MNTVVTPIGEGRRIRPLGGVERLFYLWSLAVPVHFCLVAQIEGAIDLAGLGAALEQVRRRYPALRVCILDDAETGPMFHETENKIEISTVPVKVQADWRTVVQSELNRAFEAFPGPLMRATFMRTSDGASIVLTFHHAIADGLSGVRVLRDVMRALAGEPLDALPPLPPIEEMMISSAQLQPWRQMPHPALKYLRKLGNELLHKPQESSRRISRPWSGVRKRRLAS